MLAVLGDSRSEARSDDGILAQSQGPAGLAHPSTGKVGRMDANTHTGWGHPGVYWGGMGAGCVSAAKHQGGDL